MKKNIVAILFFLIPCLCLSTQFIEVFAAPDYNKIRGQYEESAAQGNAEAQFKLGVLYAKGEGVGQNISKAQEWFERACDNGFNAGCHAFNVLNNRPSFGDYLVPVHTGKTILPEGVHKDSEGNWRNELNKWIIEPEVNFAGKYFIFINSCGTSCAYYRMTNLTTGKDVADFSMFDNHEGQWLTTKDGHPYRARLVNFADSRLLLAQYFIEYQTHTGVLEKTVCRERFFTLSESEKLTPVSKTYGSCSKF